MVNEIQVMLRAGDSFAALEHIQRQGTPTEIAARYASLVIDLYWKAHDLPAVVTIGRGGIIYCLGLSITEISSASAEELRDVAKRLAYNVGSFTWPGWEEPGIDPTDDDLAFGRDCARLNLRLAIELKRPLLGVSKAHWLLGAHGLAAGDFESAEQEFQRAQDVLPADGADAKSQAPCNLGYLAVARLCKNPDDAAATERFEAITAQLRAQDGEDAQTYLSQLVSARRLFVPGKNS